MRPMRKALPVVLTGALMFGVAACSSGSTPTPPKPTPGAPRILDTDCLDLQHDGDRLSVDLVDGLHAIDPDKAALNADFPAGKDNTVEMLAWVLHGARTEKFADGQIVVYAADRTASFPALESMHRTIVESTGTGVKASDLDLGRTRVAALPAESAAVTSKTGEDDAWTFTTGKTRFIVFAHQQPDSGGYDLSARVPGLFSLDRCPGS
ncbi:MAG TPA: hypothetical protein VFI99_03320 [Nocardioides sp.]|nr:hypothetical protein [Nocardioides sp.]